MVRPGSPLNEEPRPTLLYYFTMVSHFQLTAKLAIGNLGANAVELAAMETRRGLGRLSKNQQTGELLAQIWKKQKCAKVANVKVPSLFSYFSTFYHQAAVCPIL